MPIPKFPSSQTIQWQYNPPKFAIASFGYGGDAGWDACRDNADTFSSDQVVFWWKGLRPWVHWGSSFKAQLLCWIQFEVHISGSTVVSSILAWFPSQICRLRLETSLTHLTLGETDHFQWINASYKSWGFLLASSCFPRDLELYPCVSHYCWWLPFLL